MTEEKVRREILLDEPSDTDLFHGKGHERTANALASAIKAFKNADRAIGLDGPWGSGKSSVVGIAQRKLEEANGNGKVKFHFFTFDIWKSQGSAFRRSFLEHLVAWAHSQFPKKQSKLRDIESKIKGKIREVDTNNQLNLDLYGILVLLFVPFLPIYVLWTKQVFDSLVTTKEPEKFLYSWPIFLIYVFLIGTFVAAYAKYKLQKPSGKGRFSRFRLALSQTLLIGAKHYEHQKVTQYIRETDPNDFEFQSVLREILEAIQEDHSKVIIVLDNIDRLPPDEIAEYWALVRSIFSRTHSVTEAQQNSQITAIVPYDRRHIEVAADKNKGGDGLTHLRKRELFSKTFDEVLNVAPPIMSNTKEFFEQKIRIALPDIRDADALFRVYLIFNMLIDRAGGKATPRQVISYINEVGGLYALHAGRVPLPTVAAYLALQDGLEENPASLAVRETVDDHLRSLAADGELERNLAAILFNVEPELAFQILLDGEIETAANAETSDRLIALSKSPGFDVRVNDVFVASASSWRSSSNFAPMVNNFAELLFNYDGEASSHLRKSAVAALLQLPDITLGKDTTAVVKLLGVCASEDRAKVLQHILTATASGLGTDKDQAKGRAFSKFLANATAAALSVDPKMQTAPLLKKVVLPSNPSFLFGFAAEASISSVGMQQLAKPVLDLSSEATFLETIAVQQPSDSLAAFSSFKAASLLTDDQWNAIANALASSLIDDETGLEQFQEQLTLLSAIRSFTSISKIKDNDLNNLFASGKFYQNLYNAYGGDTENIGITDAIFLVGDLALPDKLPQPTRVNANGQRVRDAQDEQAWLNGFLSGESPLTKEQVDNLVDKLIAHYRIPWWAAHGVAKPGNQLISAVVGTAFARSRVPWISTADLMRLYPYIKKSIGADFEAVLPRLGGRLDESDLSKIAVEAYPSGILEDTAKFSAGEWRFLHERADALLDEIQVEGWMTSFATGDVNLLLLVRKAKSSGYSPSSTAVRDAFRQFSVGVLDGSITDVPAADFDAVFSIIDAGYHLETLRTIRESVKSTSVETLGLAIKLFPITLKRLIKEGEKSKQEKENLVRFFLRPGLEGKLAPVIDAFLQLKRPTVADFIRASDQSVRDSIEPALRLFSRGQSGNFGYVQKVGELVQGRKSKSFFERVFSFDSSETNDDDETP